MQAKVAVSRKCWKDRVNHGKIVMAKEDAHFPSARLFFSRRVHWDEDWDEDWDDELN